jgi:dTDP-4-dehydrorhamnose 3,5-epimerase
MRGIHFQWEPPMGKLVRCISGAVLDVVVDVRHGSPTLGDHAAVELDGDQLPHHLGAAGISRTPPSRSRTTPSSSTSAARRTARARKAGSAGTIRALGIRWPEMPTIVSREGQVAPSLAEWLADPRSQAFRV